ncbi:MAG: DUF5791 family protein [Natronomonas sp.]
MFHELVEEPTELTTDELYDRYVTAVAAAIEDAGVAAVAEATSVDRETLTAISAGRSPESELTLEDAAAILGVSDEHPDGETIATLSRDALLMGMTTAVLDVEAIESGLGGELEAREIQSKVEGRFPMTLREFALLYGFIEGKK